MKPIILATCLCLFAFMGCTVIQGNLKKTYESEYHHTVQASSDALNTLKIPVTKKMSDGLKTVMNAKRFDGTTVTIEVVRINQKLTEVSVSSGNGFVLDKRVSTQIHEFIDENLTRQTTHEISEENLDDGAVQKTLEADSIIESDDQIKNQRPPKLTQFYTDSVFIIYFNKDSNELTEKAKEKLDRVSEIIFQNPKVEIMLNGYTDSIGSPSYNQFVSEDRANVVKIYLTGKGVDPSKVTSMGYGPQKFLASNKTKEGRRFNRRVEIELNSPATR